ncbi:methyl-accepting chemotaxis protein [Kineothrix alysoides]|uniref:Methyl-accepting chemotaxis protein n=1 Tax=Kineothrix alysoides TaxID=1469948 RepID=A0A4R1R5E2_9FIRM|nr:methyl-accepting chemotaxis protein [Kineothrix alysoides]TCL60670.1 methyl-accepting chemotaxis protein [Kineothrix alysoides]
MKLRTQILLLVSIPLLALGAITYVIGSQRITAIMTDTIEKGLISTTIAVRDTISSGREGDFRLDENGDMWKGDSLNISQSAEVVDDIKEETGMEVTIFFGDTRYMTSVKDDKGERAIGTKASDKVIEIVLTGGNDYFAQRVDVAGEEFFAYYLPIYNGDSNTPVGMVFTGISQEKAEASINNILYSLLGIILISVVLFVAVAWLISNGIIKGVKAGVGAIEEVANGNLTVNIDTKAMKRKDEVGEMLTAIAKLKEELVRLIGQIADKSGQVHREAEVLSKKAESASEMMAQVEKATSDIAAGAGSQAEETQEATENIVLMGSMVEETNREVGSLADNSSQIKESGDAATDTLQELNDINHKVTEAIGIIYQQTNTTNESAMKIKEATSLITSIAEETNLLSLNATIEAARAGEQGRGFAVVAAQIQKLAEQSDESARQIETIISDLIHDSQEAVTTMNEIKEIMKEQNIKVTRTDDNFDEVKAGISQSMLSIKAIADQTKKLDEARVKVIDGVQNLTAIAQENAASTEETSASVMEVGSIVENIAASAGGLEKIADELKESIGTFRL